MKKSILLIFVLSTMLFVQPTFGLNDPLIHVNLNSRLDILAKQLKEDPTQFHKEASRIKSHQIQDKNAAVDFYFLLSQYYYEIGQFDSMAWSMHQASAYTHSSNSDKLASIFLQLGTAFYFTGNYDSLNFYQEKVAGIIDEKSSLYAQYLLVDGLMHQVSSNYTKSIESIIGAAKILESQNDQARLAITYNNLAVNYGIIQLTDLQLEYLLKSIAINKELGISYHLALNYNNLGAYYKMKDNLEAAASYYELAYDNLIKYNFPYLLAQNLTNRANVHEKLEEYHIAEKLFLECERICEENQILYGRMLSALNLGNLYRIQKRFQESEIRLIQALEFTQVLKTKREEVLTLERLFWLARDRKDFAKALDFQSSYHALNDSIISEKVKKEANELREMYEVEKKENEIINLSKQKLMQQYAISLMAFGLLILLIALQWWRNKHKLEVKEKQKQELKRKHLKEVLAHKDKELTEQAMQLIQIQKQLEVAKDKITKILFEGSVEQSNLNKIDAILKKSSLTDAKNSFDFRLITDNEDFFQNILKNHPDLTPAELKLCAYLRLNLSTKDLAEILNRSERTIESTRTNIRKKLRLEPKDNLVTHLLTFASE
jgi:DNA-binding CsgD family transcriptional regulator